MEECSLCSVTCGLLSVVLTYNLYQVGQDVIPVNVYSQIYFFFALCIIILKWLFITFIVVLRIYIKSQIIFLCQDIFVIIWNISTVTCILNY